MNCRLANLMVLTTLAMVSPYQFVHSQQAEIDPFTGLKMDADWELVRNNCIACHSLKLVTQQSGSEARWLGVIRWMQEKQNLKQFDLDTESRIIAYLAANYPPQPIQRRAAIPRKLMPPNPHSE